VNVFVTVIVVVVLFRLYEAVVAQLEVWLRTLLQTVLGLEPDPDFLSPSPCRRQT
jgi:hypothetical protein